MDWRAQAEQDIKHAPEKRAAIAWMERRIKSLEEYYCNDTKAMLDCAAELKRLRANVKICKSAVCGVDAGLCALNDEEQKIVTIMARGGNADRLAMELHMSRRSVYRAYNKALQKYTLSCYGTMES